MSRASPAPAPRRTLTSFALLAVAATVLSTLTVLGLRWAAGPHKPAAAQPQLHIGFTRLDLRAPGLALPSLSGRGTVSLTMLAGQPIVLNLWSTTCGVCKKETPALAAVAGRLRGKVRFLGVDSADSRGPATAFATRYKVPYPIAFDPRATAAAAYRVGVLPVTFFLSSSGRTILGVNFGALTVPGLYRILRTLYGVT